MKVTQIIYIIAVSFFILGCDKGGETPRKEEDEQNKKKEKYNFKNDKEMIKGFVNKIIFPNTSLLKSDAQKFQELADSYSKEQTTDGLIKVREQWLKVAKSWARCYAFNIGTLKRQYFALRFANFPINTQGLEQIITSKELVNESVVKSMGSDTKGILGLEYLLYGKENAVTNNTFEKSENRKKLLQLMTEELSKNATSYHEKWEEYSQSLINNESESGNISNSFNLIFNGLNNAIHYAWETKIGKPAGLEKSKIISKDRVEAAFSKKSLEFVKENISMTKEVFFSNKTVNISDKIKFVTKNDDLNNTIKKQYEKIENAIDAIEKPLSIAIESEKEKVRILHNELKRLEIYFSTDVKSTLSLIITGTDGDGD